MADINELDRTLPAHFTLSNKKLIIIAKVREEMVYFYDQLDRHTTVILLTEPDCYPIKHIFLEFMNDLGVTVIDLREKETFDQNYKLSSRSKEIIQKIIYEYRYKQIITHPKYDRNNDPQNRELHDFVSDLIAKLKTDNHYVYKKTDDKIIVPCETKLRILKMYASIGNYDRKLNEKMYNNYIKITERIDGITKQKN